MEDHDDLEKGYAWEAEYHKSWDVAAATAAATVTKTVKQTSVAIHRGLLRQLVICIDASDAMLLTDMQPTRFEHSLKLVQDFLVEFFDQNPLGHVAIVGIKDGMAALWCAFEPNAPSILKKLRKTTPSGDASLQNALELSRQSLRYTPDYISREVLVLYGGLNCI